MSDEMIYCSAEIERLMAARQFDARVWADEFVRLAALVPEMPTDYETMLSWFAGAIMTGHGRGAMDAQAAMS